jgi:hypothetical protein
MTAKSLTGNPQYLHLIQSLTTSITPSRTIKVEGRQTKPTGMPKEISLLQELKQMRMQ